MPTLESIEHDSVVNKFMQLTRDKYNKWFFEHRYNNTGKSKDFMHEFEMCAVTTYYEMLATLDDDEKIYLMESPSVKVWCGGLLP